METIFFYIFATVCVASALSVILARNPVYSAISLVTTFISLACLYVLMDAEFLAAMQILVYAGAMMILILFAIFLMDLNQNDFGLKWHLQTPFAYILGLGILGEIVLLIIKYFMGDGAETFVAAKTGDGSSVAAIGDLLFNKYLLPFEIISIFLLAALIGATVLTKGELLKEPKQKEQN